jgi:hypothetical protein
VWAAVSAQRFLGVSAPEVDELAEPGGGSYRYTGVGPTVLFEPGDD